MTQKDKVKGLESWNYYPKEFSSYEEYVSYLKDNGLAYEAPGDLDSIIMGEQVLQIRHLSVHR